MSSHRHSLVAAVLVLASSGPALAQDRSPQDPAPTFQAGESRVTFMSEGSPLAGRLFFPPGFRDGERLPLIVVTGSWTTVKEQMPNVYARRLAAEGFAALTFDFRGYGESGGEPRQYESPERKIADYLNAADFAMTLRVVDPERLGALAICASGGYLAHAAARGAPFRSLAFVAPWLHDPGSVQMIYGGNDGQGVTRRIRLGAAARTKFERTGVVDYVPAHGSPEEGSAMSGADYYMRGDRGRIPEWDNRFAVMSWAEWLTFDAVSPGAQIHPPTLVFLPNRPEWQIAPVERFFAQLPGPKHLERVPGFRPDYYDRDPEVSRAIALVVPHFKATLGMAMTP